MAGRIEPTSSFSITKDYFHNIGTGKHNLESIAAKVSVVVFPLFILITLFTLLSDLILMIANKVCFHEKPKNQEESIEDKAAAAFAALQPLPDIEDGFFDVVDEISAPTNDAETKAPEMKAKKVKQARNKNTRTLRELTKSQWADLRQQTRKA